MELRHPTLLEHAEPFYTANLIQTTINSLEQALHFPSIHTFSLYLNPAPCTFSMPAAPKQRKIAIVGSRSVGKRLSSTVLNRCLLSVRSSDVSLL